MTDAAKENTRNGGTHLKHCTMVGAHDKSKYINIHKSCSYRLLGLGIAHETYSSIIAAKGRLLQMQRSKGRGKGGWLQT